MWHGLSGRYHSHYGYEDCTSRSRSEVSTCRRSYAAFNLRGGTKWLLCYERIRRLGKGIRSRYVSNFLTPSADCRYPCTPPDEGGNNKRVGHKNRRGKYYCYYESGSRRGFWSEQHLKKEQHFIINISTNDFVLPGKNGSVE